MDSKIYRSDVNVKYIHTIKNSCKPIVIWGTKTAAKIAYYLCLEMNIDVVAFGDNNRKHVDTFIGNKPIITTSEAIEKYDNAIVFLGTFYVNIEEKIIEGFNCKENNISFVSFSIISFWYEKLILKRSILNEMTYFKLLISINNYQDIEFNQKINKYYVLEYQHRIKSVENDELKEFIKGNIGIKELLLLIPAKYITEELIEFIRKEYIIDQIGHLILITDSINNLSYKLLSLIKETFFYIRIFNEDSSNEKGNYKLDKNGIVFEYYNDKNINLEYENKRYDNIVTEKIVCDSIREYIGNGNIVKPITNQEVAIVQIFNGLANQMIMYLFGKFIEKYTHKMVIFDDSVLALDIFDRNQNVERMQKWCKNLAIDTINNLVEETRDKNSFYLFQRAEIAEVFNIEIKLLSDYFDKESWKCYLKKIRQDFCPVYAQPFPLGQLLIRKGFKIFIVQDNLLPKEYRSVNNFARISIDAIDFPPVREQLMDSLLKYTGNIYYLGGWSNCEKRDWLIKNKIIIQKFFKFEPILSKKNEEIVHKILNSYAVIIHIRRGDFILAGMSCDSDYFCLAVKALNNMNVSEKLEFFVFSDDIEWCRENIADMIRNEVNSEPIFVDENKGINSYIDMYLMSLGKIFIPNPKSTFSHMAIVFAPNAKFMVNEQKYKSDKEKGILKQIEFLKI